MKQMTLRLSEDVFNNFYRIMPEYGQRQFFLRLVIRETIKQISENPDSLDLPQIVTKNLKVVKKKYHENNK